MTIFFGTTHDISASEAAGGYLRVAGGVTFDVYDAESGGNLLTTVESDSEGYIPATDLTSDPAEVWVERRGGSGTRRRVIPQGKQGPSGTTDLAAKGDLLSHDGTSVVAVGVGADGTLPVADSGATSGLRYTSTAVIEGTGDPNGSMDGPRGSRFINTEAGGYNGAMEWVKTSASGDTSGWVVTYGDTGWRDVSGDVNLRTDGTAHLARVRRTGDSVDVYFDLTSPSDTTSPWNFYTLPAGFTFQTARYGALVFYKGTISSQTYLASNGELRLYGSLSAGTRDRYWGFWSTNDAWPSTLPGTSA